MHFQVLIGYFDFWCTPKKKDLFVRISQDAEFGWETRSTYDLGAGYKPCCIRAVVRTLWCALDSQLYGTRNNYTDCFKLRKDGTSSNFTLNCLTLSKRPVTILPFEQSYFQPAWQYITTKIWIVSKAFLHLLRPYWPFCYQFGITFGWNFGDLYHKNINLGF